jgi:hypothetical protein
VPGPWLASLARQEPRARTGDAVDRVPKAKIKFVVLLSIKLLCFFIYYYFLFVHPTLYNSSKAKIKFAV